MHDSLFTDAKAFCITLAGALFITRGAHLLKKHKVLGAGGTRKACHIAVGTVYVLSLVNYTDHGRAKYMAASVVAISTVQVVLVGLGLYRDNDLVEGMSRNGRATELLYGPFLYGAVAALWTVVGWRSSPSAVVGLMALFTGDGLAGLVGGLAADHAPALAKPLPWNRSKTWIGSLACLAGSFLGSVGMLHLFASVGQMPLLAGVPWGRVYRAVALSSLTATLAESLPAKEVDNLYVPAVASATMRAMLGPS